LTRGQNAIIDCALLTALAESAGQRSSLVLDRGARVAIKGLTEANDRRVASGALLELIPPEVLGTRTALQQALADDQLFVEMATGLRDHTLLWLRLEGDVGDRELVKFTYDVASTDRLLA
jgi:hypothetical protein